MPRWQIGKLPDGPVQLWIFVFSDTGEPLGAEPSVHRPRWLWRDGRLCVQYSPVRIWMARGGRYATALICAADPGRGVFQPLWPVSLGPSGELKAGDSITIADGMLALTPELPGPHG